MKLLLRSFVQLGDCRWIPYIVPKRLRAYEAIMYIRGNVNFSEAAGPFLGAASINHTRLYNPAHTHSVCSFKCKSLLSELARWKCSNKRRVRSKKAS